MSVELVTELGAVICAELAIRIVRWLGETVKRVRSERSEKVQLLEELFGFLRKSQATIDKRYPWREETLSWYDRQALQIFAKTFLTAFKGNRKLICIEGNIGKITLSKNLCIIGSPLVHRLARLAMGYDLITGDIISCDLPLLFNFRLEKRCKDKTIEELLKLEEIEKREPNWAIMENSPKGKQYIPDLDEDGILWTDYSLITVMKNNFCPESMNKKLLIVFGCHGVGTTAAMNALNDLQLLREIYHHTKGADEFQVLLKSTIQTTKNRRVPIKTEIVRIEIF